jgi:hypothetical protein
MSKDRIEFNEAYGEWWIVSGDTGEPLATCDTYKEACKLVSNPRQRSGSRGHEQA